MTLLLFSFNSSFAHHVFICRQAICQLGLPLLHPSLFLPQPLNRTPAASSWAHFVSQYVCLHDYVWVCSAYIWGGGGGYDTHTHTHTMQPQDLDKFPVEKCGVSTSGHLEVGILQSAAALLLDYIILLKSVIFVHLNTHITRHVGAFIHVYLCVCVCVDVFFRSSNVVCGWRRPLECISLHVCARVWRGQVVIADVVCFKHMFSQGPLKRLATIRQLPFYLPELALCGFACVWMCLSVLMHLQVWATWNEFKTAFIWWNIQLGKMWNACSSHSHWIHRFLPTLGFGLGSMQPWTSLATVAFEKRHT